MLSSDHDATEVTLKPSSPRFHLSGRWAQPSPDATSLVASWCGASISFLLSGKFLRLRTGSRTERKDSFNGGTSMLACSVRSFSQDKEEVTTTYDCASSQEITLLDVDSLAGHALPVKITITLIDWASVLELEDIVVDSVCDSLRRHIPF